MIKIERITTEGWEPAIRGMRNPLDSWDKSDSRIFDYYREGEQVYHDIFDNDYYGDSDGEIHFKKGIYLGPNDLDLMMRLAKSGTEHAKYRRMIVVWMDITAPLYWWKEFDTYKVGTVADSCSTMHTIHKREFTPDDFSCDHLGYYDADNDGDGICETNDVGEYPYDSLTDIIGTLNFYRKRFDETRDKKYWWQLIQLLPSSYNQKRTVMLNYEVLANIYRQRRNHKLDEWHVFCKVIEKGLPYSQIITLEDDSVERISNVICDMAIAGASENDIRKAVQRSMEIIDERKKRLHSDVKTWDRFAVYANTLHEMGVSNSEISRRLHISEASVRGLLWRVEK